MAGGGSAIAQPRPCPRACVVLKGEASLSTLELKPGHRSSAHRIKNGERLLRAACRMHAHLRESSPTGS
eukprot:scaffold216525_cov25-Tisochrysis_lutea.AAC.5